MAERKTLTKREKAGLLLAEYNQPNLNEVRLDMIVMQLYRRGYTLGREKMYVPFSLRPFTQTIVQSPLVILLSSA